MKVKVVLAFTGVIAFVLGSLLLIFGARYNDWLDKYGKSCTTKPPPHLPVYSLAGGGLLILMGGLFILWGWGHHLGHTHGTVLHVK